MLRKKGEENTGELQRRESREEEEEGERIRGRWRKNLLRRDAGVPSPDMVNTGKD